LRQVLDLSFKMDAKFIERAQDERQLGARASALDADDPLSADANAASELGLAEAKSLAAVPNDCAEIGRCAKTHRISCLRSMTLWSCQRSMTSKNVSDR
jgi:hypothetical protein